MYEIILASQSPRRRQLLENAGYKIHVHPVKVSENIEENLNPRDYVTTLSQRKALYFLDTVKSLNLKEKLLIAADTVVAIDNRILGKPENFQQAVSFLHLLSGREHSVITGLTVVPDGLWSEQISESVETRVSFHPLSQEDIEGYVNGGEPMDKAGGYAIQGEGKKFVDKYEGSWSNVVGLPMEVLQALFLRKSWNVSQTKS